MKKPYQFCFMSYQPQVAHPDQIAVALIFKVEGEQAQIFTPDVTPRLARVWPDFEPEKFKSLIESYVKGLLFYWKGQSDKGLDRHLEFARSGCFRFSSIRGGIHEDPTLRALQLVEKYLLAHV